MSAGTVVSDGDGTIGDLIGITDSQPMAAVGTTRAAILSTTGATSTVGQTHALDSIAGAAVVAPPATGLAAEESEHVVGRTVPVRPRGLSKGTREPREDTPHPAVKAVSVRVLTAAMIAAVRRKPILHGEAPAWERPTQEEDLVVAVAGMPVVADMVAVVATDRRC